ncbi:hypothetical protein FBZ85_1472 [Azospirillum brasilense]|nr:hypothetical protein FBZ85_1472 [Azospirillum brasilense]
MNVVSYNVEMLLLSLDIEFQVLIFVTEMAYQLLHARGRQHLVAKLTTLRLVIAMDSNTALNPIIEVAILFKASNHS